MLASGERVGAGTAVPQRAPLEITVLFPAGSSADVTARMLADGMSKALGQRVLVVNRPGAGGAIGYKYVAAQKPDGYSLVWNSNSISTTYHSGQLAFDYQAFDAVARVLVESPVSRCGRMRAGARCSELIDEAQARSRRQSASATPASAATRIFASSALTHAAGVEVNEVPFAAPRRWCRA